MAIELLQFPVQVSLADIPGRLRQIADDYEQGKYDGLPKTFLYVEGFEDGSVKVGCFGDNPSKWELVGLLTLAADKFSAEAGDTRRAGGN